MSFHKSYPCGHDPTDLTQGIAILDGRDMAEDIVSAITRLDETESTLEET